MPSTGTSAIPDHPRVDSAVLAAWCETARGDASARLSDLVIRCSNLDGDSMPFPGIGKDDDAPERSDRAFHQALRSTVVDFRLGRLFAWNGDGTFHRSLIPRAYDRLTGEVHEAGMMQWRADYRSLPPERQMLSATIVWLYRSGPDSIWLRRVPCTWRADEALHYMNDAGCLGHWIDLVATCPGW